MNQTKVQSELMKRTKKNILTSIRKHNEIIRRLHKQASYPKVHAALRFFELKRNHIIIIIVTN